MITEVKVNWNWNCRGVGERSLGLLQVVTFESKIISLSGAPDFFLFWMGPGFVLTNKASM